MGIPSSSYHSTYYQLSKEKSYKEILGRIDSTTAYKASTRTGNAIYWIGGVGCKLCRCCDLCFNSGSQAVLLLSRFLTPNGWRNQLCLRTTRSERLDHSTAHRELSYKLAIYCTNSKFATMVFAPRTESFFLFIFFPPTKIVSKQITLLCAESYTWPHLTSAKPTHPFNRAAQHSSYHGWKQPTYKAMHCRSLSRWMASATA